MLIVVFDTVIFVRALINPRGLWGRLVFVHSERYRLVVSAALVAELLDVLQRSELTRKFRTLDGLDARRLLNIVSAADHVEPEDVPAVSRDVKDDKVLAAAWAAHADYLVTEDNDLLVLGTHGRTCIVHAIDFLTALESEGEATPPVR